MFAPQSITPAADDAASNSAGEGGAGCGDAVRDAIDQRALRRVRTLDRLGDHGMDLVEGMKRDALAPAAPAAAPQTDPAPAAAAAEAVAARWASYALIYARLARAVRQSLALAGKLDVDSETRRAQGLQAAQAGKARAAQAAARPDPINVQTQADDVRRARREEAAEIITPLLEDAVDALDDPVRAERLYDSLYERLDDPDDTVGLMDRPMGQVVASICRDLGLTPDWKAWSEEDWAIDEGEARPPGSPFMTVRVTTDRSYSEPEPRAILRPSWVAAQTATGPPST